MKVVKQKYGLSLVGVSSWWNKPRSEMTPDQLKLKREYDKRAKSYARQTNNKKIKEQCRKYFNNNRDKVYQRNKKWRQKNWKKVYAKRKQSIHWVILERLRSRLHKALNGKIKMSSAKNLLGCNADELKRHLEKQFIDDMSWNNYGLKGWHIDHIIPCSSFDLTDIKQQKICFHYTNLQPLWAEDNLKKSNKISNSVNI